MSRDDLLRVHLGSKVSTPHGDGVVVKISTRFNGLHILDGNEDVTVYYPEPTRRRYVNFTFRYTEIELI